MKRMSPAETAWLGLGAYVLVADVILWRTDRDTMSIQFGRWLETKAGRDLCLLCTAGMVAHLFWGLPLPFQAKARRYLGGRQETISRPLEISLRNWKRKERN